MMSLQGRVVSALILGFVSAHSVDATIQTFKGEGPIDDADVEILSSLSRENLAAHSGEDALPSSCEDLIKTHGNEVPSGEYELYQPDRYELHDHGYQLVPVMTYCHMNDSAGRQKRSASPAFAVQRPNNTTRARDCADIFMYYLTGDRTTASGVYQVYNPKWYQLGPKGIIPLPIYVYCDMKTNGGGYTMLQRRMDGSVNFTRSYHDYEHGFGLLNGEFWMGLRFLTMMTSLRKNSLLIQMISRVDNSESYAKYNDFLVEDAHTGYKLGLGCYSGNDPNGDKMTYHKGSRFTTYDRDQDTNGGNCAKSTKGGNWFKSCFHNNLNGVYGQVSGVGAICWDNQSKAEHVKKFVQMSFRPEHYQ